MTTSAHAARIVRRAGFGASGAEIRAVDGLSVEDVARTVLAAPAPADRAAQLPATPHFELVQRVKRTASPEARSQGRMETRGQLLALTSWWLRRMIATDRPSEEKLTFLWHDYFATAATKVRSAHLLLTQNSTLRRLGRGDFRDLAGAMLTDPAMLVWLDGRRNTRKAPNENLSREFMEIFTLGHGAFTETDVREGARALTGWKISPDGTAAFHQNLHDSADKTVLGVQGNLDAAGFCDAVLARPASARYVATRMWHALASPSDPSPLLLQRLVTAYGSGRDITRLLTAIVTSPEFAAAAGTLVVSPIEWLVGAVRALNVRIEDDQAVRPLLPVLRSLGQLPFYPPSVAGWPTGQAWLSTSSVTTRLATAGTLAGMADLSAISRVAQSSRVEAVAHLLGIPALTDRSAKALTGMAASPARLVTLALNTPEYLTH